MLANYHTHTYRCMHAVGEDREYVESAIQGGLKVLGISDHCPWVFNDGHVSNIRMAPREVEEYFSTYEKLREEYKKDITIYIGYESEYIPELIEDQKKLLKDYPLDYMIMGQHFTKREPFGPYTGIRTREEADLKKYVDLVIEGMETGLYQYIAHPDLCNFVGAADRYEFHMTRLCTYLKEKNIPVEINMLGLLEGRHYPSEQFFKIAQKVGNTAIIGIDAHTPSFLSDQAGKERCKTFAAGFELILVDYLPGLGSRS